MTVETARVVPGLSEGAMGPSLPLGLRAVLATVLVCVIGGGLWFVRSEGRRLRSEAESQLETIGSLKVDQIVAWRGERLGDASVLSENARISEAVAQFLSKPGPVSREPLLVRFRPLERQYGYDDVLLVDTEGQVRLSLKGTTGEIHDDVRRVMAEAFLKRRAVLSDIHAGPGLSPPHLEALAPVFAPPEASGAPIGAILLRSEARRFLYPLISSWPGPSRSAETLLVRRDGDSVLFLNELRHRTHTALHLRLPLSRMDLPAAQAVLGRRGVAHGRDYRGVDVLSVVYPVPDSPWFMVAKVDAAEALAPARSRAWLVAGLLVLLIVAGIVTFLAFWQHASKSHYRRLYEAERARLESEGRYRSLFDHMVEGYAYCRMLFENGEPRDFVYVDVNPAFVTLTGLKDVVGRKVTEVIPGIRESNPELLQIYGRVTSTGAPESFETYVEPLRIWFHVSVYGPLPEHFVAVFENITERKRTEEALRESEERYRTVAEFTFDWEYWRAPDDSLRYVSPSCERITGYPADAFLADPGLMDRIVHPDDRAALDAHHAHVGQAAESRLAIDIRIVRSDGRELWMNHSCLPVYGRDGKVTGRRGSNRDITDRKTAEAQLHRLYDGLEQRVYERTAQLEAANKELEAFSYSVSHDLRSPLRAIEGFARILLEDHATALSPEGQRLLGVVGSNVRKMSSLIDDILAFSRLGRQDLRVAHVDMGALARAVGADLLAGRQGGDVDLAIGDLPPASGDPALLRQVLVNLIDNALKYSAPQGAIRIRVEGHTENEEQLYSVEDNGVGFEMAYADKLFGVFQRLHSAREFEGTGVGLAIVKRIVLRHGGRVGAEGRPGEGARFWFALPKTGGTT